MRTTTPVSFKSLRVTLTAAVPGTQYCFWFTILPGNSQHLSFGLSNHDSPHTTSEGSSVKILLSMKYIHLQNGKWLQKALRTRWTHWVRLLLKLHWPADFHRPLLLLEGHNIPLESALVQNQYSVSLKCLIIIFPPVYSHSGKKPLAKGEKDFLWYTRVFVQGDRPILPFIHRVLGL